MSGFYKGGVWYKRRSYKPGKLGVGGTSSRGTDQLRAPVWYDTPYNRKLMEQWNKKDESASSDIKSKNQRQDYGSEGIDQLIGTNDRDRLYGRGGNDSLSGLKGNDEIWGGGGSDAIFAGAGDDYIQGEGGHDFIRGGEGSDKIYGGLGKNIISVGVDDDVDEVWLESDSKGNPNGNAGGANTDILMDLDPGEDKIFIAAGPIEGRTVTLGTINHNEFDRVGIFVDNSLEVLVVGDFSISQVNQMLS